MWIKRLINRLFARNAETPPPVAAAEVHSHFADMADFEGAWSKLDSSARDTLVRIMMVQFGIPEELRGIAEVNFQAPMIAGKYQMAKRHYLPDSALGGVNVPAMGIAVDAGIENPHLMTEAGLPIPEWPRASVKERIEAVIVHEFLEATSSKSTVSERHADACRRGADTSLPISPQARQILVELHQSLPAKKD